MAIEQFRKPFGIENFGDFIPVWTSDYVDLEGNWRTAVLWLKWCSILKVVA